MDEQQTVVTFRMDALTYALPIEPIAQIIEMVTMTPIPQASQSVAGVITVRGAAVPVIDLRCHFGLPAVRPGLHTPIILVRLDGRSAGLMVDDVVDVQSLSGEQIARLADIL